jgi:hypothetical protein
LAWVKPAEDPELINSVENKSNDENLAHRLPTAYQHFSALRRIGNQSKRLPPGKRVPSGIPNCEEGRHEWLEDKPKM